MSLWDIAAPLTIGARLGIRFRWMDSDQDLISFSSANLTENWKIRASVYAAYEANIERFKEILADQVLSREGANAR